MRFTNIAKTVELKKGFVRASAVFGKTMVLLFKIDKGVLLDNHNHPHIQLGYCFEGEFDFTAADETIPVHAGDSYQLPSNVYHSAVATTDYYSMDYKIISDEVIEKPAYNILKETEKADNYSVSELMFGGNLLRKYDLKSERTEIKLQPSDNKKLCLFVSDDVSVQCGEEKSELKPMEIYLLENKQEISIDGGCTLFVVEV